MRQHSPKSKKPFIVREANDTDAAAIKNIVNSVAPEKYFVVPESSREDWNKTIEEIKNRKGLTAVAQVNEETVGIAYLVRGKFDKNSHVGFLGISILKKFRGIGIGTAMMNYLIEWAKDQEEPEKISLIVFSTNKVAISLYRKFGFKIEGVSKKQYKIEGEYIDEITMGKFLN
jgi:RimJ/RimL family protein N-acetyltransferase